LLLTTVRLPRSVDGIVTDTWSSRLFEVQKTCLRSGFLSEGDFVIKVIKPLLLTILGLRKLDSYTTVCTKLRSIDSTHRLSWAELPPYFVERVVPELRAALKTPEYQNFLDCDGDLDSVETFNLWVELHGSAGFPGAASDWTDYRNIMWLDRACYMLPVERSLPVGLGKAAIPSAPKQVFTQEALDLMSLDLMSYDKTKLESNPFELPNGGAQAQDLWPFSTGEMLKVVKVGTDIRGVPYQGVVPGDQLVVDRWTVNYASSNVDSKQRRLCLYLRRTGRMLEVDVDAWPVWLVRVDQSEVQDRVERELYDAVYDGSNLKPVQDKTTGKALTRQAAREKRAAQVDAMNQKLYDQVKDFSEEEMISFRSVLDLSARLAEEFTVVTEEETDALIEFLQTRRERNQSAGAKRQPKIRILEPMFIVDPEPDDPDE
jgi:hypothetical protein